jgi:hypothetical protein
MRVGRLRDGPIIHPGSHSSLGENIQGPSLIRVPGWVRDPLGRYYLYFADHKGAYLRLAYADAVEGPWTVHPPGSLQLGESLFLTEPPEVPAEMIEQAEALVETLKLPNDVVHDLGTPHIASPDVRIDDASLRIVLYYHGLHAPGIQLTRAATSKDGLHFEAHEPLIGRPYFRHFRHQGRICAMAMPGEFYRSDDGLADFERGPTLFNRDMRHAALLVRGDTLHVFWTQVGDAPERILHSTIDISGDWSTWKESEPVEVLRPEHDWEGADAPLEPSVRSVAHGHVNQLRDPAVFEDEGRTFLLYAVAGESGIALAELFVEYGR